jgi:hypothetical protein
MRVVREVLESGGSLTVEREVEASGRAIDVRRRRSLREGFLSRAQVLRVLGNAGLRTSAAALGPRVAVTVHPSSILRASDAAGRAAARRAFVNDLRRILRQMKESS